MNEGGWSKASQTRVKVAIPKNNAVTSATTAEVEPAAAFVADFELLLLLFVAAAEAVPVSRAGTLAVEAGVDCALYVGRSEAAVDVDVDEEGEGEKEEEEAARVEVEAPAATVPVTVASPSVWHRSTNELYATTTAVAFSDDFVDVEIAAAHVLKSPSVSVEHAHAAIVAWSVPFAHV